MAWFKNAADKEKKKTIDDVKFGAIDKKIKEFIKDHSVTVTLTSDDITHHFDPDTNKISIDVGVTLSATSIKELKSLVKEIVEGGAEDQGLGVGSVDVQPYL